jgi:hypothetical protein
MIELVSVIDHPAEPEVARRLETASLPSTPFATDPWLYRFAILTLGVLAMVALGGSVFLTAIGHDAPQVTVALGSAAVGALAGLLTPPPSRGQS